MSERFISFEDIDFTLVCQDSPYCNLTPEQKIAAQKKNCIFCSRVYVDCEGNAEADEPYFETVGDE